jgi:hypothetical protein
LSRAFSFSSELSAATIVGLPRVSDTVLHIWGGTHPVDARAECPLTVMVGNA